MSTSPIPQAPMPGFSLRFSRQQYEEIERLCPQPIEPRGETSSAEFRLGVQFVLQLLRQGVV